ncbi:tetratricopeptide repeat protein [Neochlamydia sp. S13]|uniref:tetratricopeptide repeat protein n=1 Tax=Neochlamydia sp. S13 TaxID=1353976 RepID=UPI00131508AE|nr:tetratricopeptide repeat protein [Neochlamydia sp. S13]
MNQLSSDSLRIHPLIFPAFEKKEEPSFCIRETNAYREISLKIFKELGFQDLCQAKLICREWKQLIESSPLAENIYTIGLKLAIQKNNPMREKVCAEKLVQEAYCIEKLGDIYLEKGTSETLLQAAGLYNYALQIVSDDKKKFFEEKLLKAQHLLINVCQGKVLDNNRIRKEFKSNCQALKIFREEIEEMIQSLPETPSFQEVKELYGKIAQDIKAFFSLLVNQALDVLGPAHCEYAVIGFGSLAREEMTPYSDLEFGILIKEDNEANKKYFRNLTTLIHLKVINLGETILPALNIPCLQTIDFFDGATPRGFAFDGAGVKDKGCKTPFGNGKTFELIQTPGKMAQYIAKDEEGQWWHEKEPHLPMELLNFTHLLGSEELTKQYRKNVQHELEKPYQKGLTLRQYLAKQHLVLVDIEAFNPGMHETGRQGMLFKVKNDLYRFPHLALDRLALLKKVEASNTFTRIEQLNRLGIITADATDKLNDWMSIALFMRLKTYSHYQAQQEMMNPLIKPFGFDNPELIKKQFALDHKAIEKIKKIYRIFIPFYQAMQDFLAGNEDTLKSSNLEDNSPQAEGDIAFRLFQQKEAKKYYKSVIKTDTYNLEILNALGMIYSYQGKLGKAAKYIKKALAIDLIFFNETHFTAAIIYNNLGTLYLEQGNLKKAAECIEKAVAIDLRIYGENYPHLITDYNNLGQIHHHQGNLAKAAEYSNKALTIGLKIFGKNHSTTATIYSNLGQIYRDQGNLDKAAEYAKKALTISLNLFGENHPTIAANYNNLGMIYKDQPDLMLAAEYIRKAFEIDFKFFGENHPKIAIIYNNLGLIYHEQQDLEQALKYIKKALAIERRLFGKNHPSMAIRYHNLGAIYRDQGNFELATEYVNKGLSISNKLFGMHHLTRASFYQTLEEIYYKQGNLEQAAKYAKKALAINLKLFTENSSKAAMCYNNLGKIYLEQGELEQAAENAKRALAINVKIFGENHLDVAIAHSNLGIIYRTQGNVEQAIENTEKALAITLKLYDENYLNVARYYNNLGELYAAKKCFELAARCFKKALIVNLRIFSENHPSTATICGNLDFIQDVAIAYAKAGEICLEKDLEKAREYANKALAIDLELFRETHSNVAIDYNLLGLIYQEECNLGQAAEYTCKALAIDLKLVGENHSNVAIYCSNLGSIYYKQGHLEQAAKYSKKALTIAFNLFEENHPIIARNYKTLWQIYNDQGNFEQAAEYSNKALT